MKDYSLHKIYLHGETFVKNVGNESYEASRTRLVADFYEMKTGKKIE